MIQCERALGEGQIAENHQADLVVRPHLDELLDDVAKAQGIDSVGALLDLQQRPIRHRRRRRVGSVRR